MHHPPPGYRLVADPAPLPPPEPGSPAARKRMQASAAAAQSVTLPLDVVVGLNAAVARARQMKDAAPAIEPTTKPLDGSAVDGVDTRFMALVDAELAAHPELTRSACMSRVHARLLARTVDAAPAAAEPTAADVDVEREVDQLLATAKQNGVNLSRSDAHAEVLRAAYTKAISR